MDLFISFRSTAKIEVDSAIHRDEPELARRASSDIDTGRMLLEAWALEQGGEVVTMTGVEGTLKLPAEKLDSLPEILERYESATNSRISVGVGFELNESETALKVAEHRGGDPAVVLFSEGVAEEAHSIEESSEESDLGPIEPKDAAVLEDDAPENDGGTEPTLQKGEGDAKPGEASKIAAGTIRPSAAEPSAPSPISPASPPSADGQAPAGGQPPPGQGQDPGQLKQAVAEVLQGIKQNMPAIQQLQQSNPEAFQSVVGLVQAFIAVAQQAFGGQAPESQMQKSESSDSTDDSIASQSLSEEKQAIKDYGERKERAQDPKLKGALGHAREEEKEHAKEFSSVMEKDEPSAHTLKPMKPNVKHRVNLPIGSQLDTSSSGTQRAGLVKVVGQDGKARMVSVRAGQILSQSGHAISSRDPKGK